MIYTFYSFKGGVGRSMALANIAELLYRRNLDVLMVDFDLEAPGLERYFNVSEAAHKADEVAGRRGVIDMLLSYKELRSLPRLEPSAPPAGEGDADGDLLLTPVEPLNNFIVPIYRKTGPGAGSLSIIPAGRRDGDEFSEYARRVRTFDWDDFYRSWEGERFFEWFRREAERVAPVVLIDSRTGVTEMSGVCVYQLADVVLMFVASNRQNIDGTLMIAKSLANPQLIEEGRGGRPLSMLFVPSRVENGEAKLLDNFAAQFNDILGGQLSHQLEHQSTLFNDVKVPYVPYFAYMESVAVRERSRASASEMIRAFENIVSTVGQLEPREGPLSELYYSTKVDKGFNPRHFIDRVAEQHVFEELLRFKSPQRILAIKSDGGTGKSYLLEKYRHRCRFGNPRTPVSLIALDQLPDASPLALVKLIANHLSAFGLKFENFERFEQARLSADFTPFASRGGPQQTSVSQLLEEVGKLVPEESDTVKVFQLTTLTPEQEAIARHFVVEAFCDDLQKCSMTNGIVLMFDSFEKTPLELRSWIESYFMERFFFRPSRHDSRLLLVIAGREIPSFAQYGAARGLTLQIIDGLSVWTKRDVEEFLRAHGFRYEAKDVEALGTLMDRGIPVSQIVQLLHTLFSPAAGLRALSSLSESPPPPPGP